MKFKIIFFLKKTSGLARFTGYLNYSYFNSLFKLLSFQLNNYTTKKYKKD